MSVARTESIVEWLLRPWLRGLGLGARAGRVLTVTGILTLLVLPGMLLYFGPGDWWWDNTLSVCVLTPLGIVLFDEGAERVGDASGRRVRGMARVAVLVAGLLFGIVAGYAFTLGFRMGPGRTTALLFADFRRTVGILTPIVLVVILVGASLFHRAEAYRLETAAARASFQVLKGQMQPHFLFNALNALSELIPDDPELARAFTQRLADLYRLIIKVSTAATTPLGDELAIVGHYLEVERVRFGDRLRYRIDSPDELMALHVPTLMLQTLVENAVKHGIGKARAGGEVKVRAARHESGGVELEVSNTGAPYRPDAAEPRTTRPTGLDNTRARLELMYGTASTLSISSDAELGTRVRCVVSGERLD